MRARAVVKLLPELRDIARIFANKQRAEFIVNDRDDGRADGRAADSAFRFAVAGQPRVGVNAYERHIEGRQAPEVARVLIVRRDLVTQPSGRDIRNLHLFERDCCND